MDELTQKKVVMLYPKPNKRHCYCGVCKNNFEEYLQHIKSEHHTRRFANNSYIQKIESLEKQYHFQNNYDPQYCFDS